MKVVLDESVPLNSNNIVHTITSVGFESNFRRCLVGKPARGPNVGVKGLGFWFSGVQVFRATGAQKRRRKKKTKKKAQRKIGAKIDRFSGRGGGFDLKVTWLGTFSSKLT